MCGYVEQMDVHSAGATVWEALLFSARMRLPEAVGLPAVRRLVEQQLEATELGPLRHAVVGVPGALGSRRTWLPVGGASCCTEAALWIRAALAALPAPSSPATRPTGAAGAAQGLTGEQRKRLSIAVELVAAPSVVFMVGGWVWWDGGCVAGVVPRPSRGCRGCKALALPEPCWAGQLLQPLLCSQPTMQDEPTSGLDARAAAVVMRAVQNVARGGRTVVVTM